MVTSESLHGPSRSKFFVYVIRERVKFWTCILQAALGQCSNGSRTTNKNDETGDVDIDAEEKDEEEELGGMRCQAPYSHDWGEMSYHNAIVLCEEEGDASDDMMASHFNAIFKKSPEVFG